MIGGQLTTGVETMASKMMASIQALPLVNQSLDLVQKSIHLLMDQSVCPRCTLRYLGIRDRGIHESINQTLTMKAEPAPQLVDSVIPSKRDHSETEDLVLEYKENHKVGEHCLGSSSSKSPCSVCLGMMNMDFKEMAVKAHEKASQFSVVDKTFYLSMRMPPQLTIRHRSISVYLKEELSKTNAYWSLPDPIELKEIFRHLVAKSYADHSGFEFTTESNLCLNVHVDHAETERDYMFLKDIPEANFKIRLLRKKGKEVVEGASMEKIQKAVGRLEFQQLHQAGQTPPPLITSEPKLKDLHFTHEPIFIAGRYNKWQRHISNTPWEIHGKRLAEHSVSLLTFRRSSLS